MCLFNGVHTDKLRTDLRPTTISNIGPVNAYSKRVAQHVNVVNTVLVKVLVPHCGPSRNASREYTACPHVLVVASGTCNSIEEL
jgi:hypothetical protein